MERYEKYHKEVCFGMKIFNNALSDACDAAINNGADFADVVGVRNNIITCQVEANKIKNCECKIGGGISVQAIYKGGRGYAYCEDLSKEAAIKAAEDAARLSKLSEPDKDFQGLVGKPRGGYPPLLLEEDILTVETQDLIRMAEANVKEARAVHPEAIVECSYSRVFTSKTYVNSLGVNIEHNIGMIKGSCKVMVRSGEDVGVSYDFDSARRLKDFNPEGLGEKAAREALKYLGARKIPTQRMSIVLGPPASMSLLREIPMNADAYAVERGLSYLKSMEGKQVASSLLTLYDLPLIDYGLNSRFVDDEGSVCKTFVIVKDGILQSYLYSSYMAYKSHRKPTGHGSRDRSATPSNVVPNLGYKTSDEIIRSTKNGIYIKHGDIGANHITGDVSNSIDFGIKIENGELAYPVQSSMIGGNILDMLKNISEISSDFRMEPGCIMPTMKIEDVLVAGADG